MRKPAVHVLTVVFNLCAAVSTVFPAAIAEPPNPRGVEFFEREIRPLLVEHCYECHSEEAQAAEGGLRLDSRGAIRRGGDSGHAVVPEKVNQSLLISALRYDDLEMPPDEKLPREVVNKFARWIKMGAPDPREGTATPTAEGIDLDEGREFWAFHVARHQTPPAVQRKDWPHSEIDQFILAKLESAELTPVDDADRVDLIRRVTFDLIGLPPTPEEVTAFVEDGSDNAFEKVVDHLLESPHFGERWGRHWLDVVRYADSTGRTRNFPLPFAWRYRDYVIASLNQDKPYDRFVTEQIAGDLLPTATPAEQDECVVATGFLALGSHDLNQRNVKQFQMDVADEQINVVSRGILAVTAACARCHDHKFDPIPTADYYALAGIFCSTDLLSGLTNRPQGGGNSGYFQEDLLASLGADKALSQDERQAAGTLNNRQAEQLDRRIEQVTRQLATLQGAAKQGTGKRRGQNKRGKKNGAGKPVRGAADPKTKAKIAQAKKSLERLEGQRDQLRSAEQMSTNRALGVRDRAKTVNCRVNIRGDIRQLGESVPRGFLQVLGDDDTPTIDPTDSGRLELARWLTKPNTPAGTLTARVLANRVWHHLFGQGLVRTVDNFGTTGERPSHPELLDHLALRLIDGDWSVKRLIREIALSRAYQLSCADDATNYDADPENRLVWRMNRRRLEVEALRDAILMVSGQLDTSPPIGSPLLNSPMVELRRIASDGSDVGLKSRHRSVYVPVLRGAVPGMFEVFDFAEPSDVRGRRDITTVATQALFMMNSPFVAEQAEHAADRLLGNDQNENHERVQTAYLRTLGRHPSEDETQRALTFVSDFASQSRAKAKPSDRDAWASFYHALFASAEFRYLN